MGQVAEEYRPISKTVSLCQYTDLIQTKHWYVVYMLSYTLNCVLLHVCFASVLSNFLCATYMSSLVPRLSLVCAYNDLYTRAKFIYYGCKGRLLYVRRGEPRDKATIYIYICLVCLVCVLCVLFSYIILVF